MPRDPSEGRFAKLNTERFTALKCCLSPMRGHARRAAGVATAVTEHL